MRARRWSSRSVVAAADLRVDGHDRGRALYGLCDACPSLRPRGHGVRDHQSHVRPRHIRRYDLATSDAQYLPSGYTITSKYLCSVNGVLPPTACSFSKIGPPVNTVYYIQVTVAGTYAPWFSYPGIASSVKVSGTTYTLVGHQ